VQNFPQTHPGEVHRLSVHYDKGRIDEHDRGASLFGRKSLHALYQEGSHILERNVELVYISYIYKIQN
jgi:hypothetical protein